MAITEKDVHCAADALLVAGERPTIERVRLKLGRGSPNTITGFLNTWFAQLGERLAGGGRAGVPEPVLAAARELWQDAQNAARAEIQTDRAAHEAELALERHALDERAQGLDAATARLAAREADLEVAVTALREQLEAAQELARTLVQQRDAAEAARAQAQTAARVAHEEAEALRERLTQQQTEHAGVLRETHERHAAQERHWLADLDGERQQNKRAQAELERIRQRCERERLDTQAAQARDAEQLRIAARTEAALRAELEAARVRLEERDEAARRGTKAAEQREFELAQQVRDLAAQLAAKEKQLDTLLVAMAKRPAARRGADIAGK
jgi:hypothetical protein